MVSAKRNADFRQAFDYARVSFAGTVQNELSRRIQLKAKCSHFAIFYKTAMPVSLPKVYLCDNLDFSCRVIYDQKKIWMKDPVLGISSEEEIHHWDNDLSNGPANIISLVKLATGDRPTASTLIYPMRNGSATLLTLIWGNSARPDVDFNELYETLFSESRMATQKICHSLKYSHPAANNLLNVREVRIMRLLADGLTSKQVADAINVTRATVYFHVKQFTRKMNSSTRSEAIIKAALLRLI